MAKHTSRIEITVQYGSETQAKIWENAIDIALVSVRDMMEKKHKDNRLDFYTFTLS